MTKTTQEGNGCPFEAGRLYETRCGADAWIYSTTGAGNTPIHGSINGVVHTWALNGVDALSGAYNLIPEKATMYVNVYETSISVARRTREEADQHAAPRRVACVRVEYKKGQFDD